MKLTKIIAAGLSALMCFPLFAACGEQTETVYQAATELSYYDGTHYEELADPYKPYYNKELWRRNNTDLSGADPLVLDNTSRDGYYYAYVTGLTYSRSKDLVTWESGGSFVSFPEELSGSDALWAPEVIYDEEDELYYAFFTVNPPADKTAGEGESAPYYMPIVATSEKASGPFVPVAFDDRNTSYPQSYAKYALFDNASYMAAFEASGVPDSTSGNSIYTVDRGYVDGDAGWVRCIDFSPYIDPDTGEKYLYWSQTPGAIAGVKMIDWFTPDWSTYKTLTACGFYTVDDYVKYMNGETVDGVYYEEMASYCNEGPFMIKHNGKYYLTYPWVKDKTECLAYAMSDNPMGPFEYKGIIMEQSPTGCWTNHHSLVEYKGQWYLFYHHNDYSPEFDKNRSVRADSLTFNPDGTIQLVTPTLRGVGITDAGKAIQLDRYSAISQEGASIDYINQANKFDGWKVLFNRKDAWVSYNRVDFGNQEWQKVDARVLSSAGGTLGVYANEKMIAEIEVPASVSEWKTLSVPVEVAQAGIQDLRVSLVKGNDVQLDWIRFE